jgi:hypothetical protein
MYLAIKSSSEKSDARMTNAKRFLIPEEIVLLAEAETKASALSSRGALTCAAVDTEIIRMSSNLRAFSAHHRRLTRP